MVSVVIWVELSQSTYIASGGSDDALVRGLAEALGERDELVPRSLQSLNGIGENLMRRGFCAAECQPKITGVGQEFCIPIVSWFRARIVLGRALMRDAYKLLEVATEAPSESWELGRSRSMSDFMVQVEDHEMRRTQSPS